MSLIHHQISDVVSYVLLMNKRYHGLVSGRYIEILEHQGILSTERTFEGQSRLLRTYMYYLYKFRGKALQNIVGPWPPSNYLPAWYFIWFICWIQIWKSCFWNSECENLCIDQKIRKWADLQVSHKRVLVYNILTFFRGWFSTLCRMVPL